MSNENVAFTDNDYCFACGSKNPLGLCLTFTLHDDGTCTSEFTASPHHQGFAGVLHGGLIATIADDLMNNHLHRMYRVTTATAELTTRYRKPAPTGVPLVFTSRRTDVKGRIHEMECTVQLKGEDSVLSVSKGRFLETKR
jgi:acyl-coenzyme A thioesterase PaaI-like protein